MDTDLNSLGLPELAKKEVQAILVQNGDLIKDREKTSCCSRTRPSSWGR